MAESEIVIMLFGIAIAAIGWGLWLRSVFGPTDLGKRTMGRAAVTLSVIASLIGLFVILCIWAADDVRTSPTYIAFYEIMGAAWLTIVVRGTGWFGISVRDDVVERRNSAATLAMSGAIGGLTLCFAGGNIGNGPGWWVVIFSASLATAGLALVWWVVEIGARISDAVTIERDLAAGLRLAALLLSAGLVLGRAVAGDWHSAGSTIKDFIAIGWPVVFLPFMESAFGHFMPTAHKDGPASLLATGIVPSSVYIGAASTYVILLGVWH